MAIECPHSFCDHHVKDEPLCQLDNCIYEGLTRVYVPLGARNGGLRAHTKFACGHLGKNAESKIYCTVEEALNKYKVVGLCKPCSKPKSRKGRHPNQRPFNTVR